MVFISVGFYFSFIFIQKTKVGWRNPFVKGAGNIDLLTFFQKMAAVDILPVDGQVGDSGWVCVAENTKKMYNK